MSVRFRSALAVSLCLGLVGAGAASAAATPKPVCNLITDPTGDGGVATSSGDLDIVSGDVATNGKAITAVLRLAGSPSAVDPQALGGKNFYVSFSTKDSDQPQFLSASFDPSGAASYGTGYEATVAGAGNKTADADPAGGSVSGNVITITAPLAAFAGRVNLKPGRRLTSLKAEAFAMIGTSVTGGLLYDADDATGKDYVAGSASCVKVGK